MKKTYTKKQITEAIAYWKNKLKKLDEEFGTVPKAAKVGEIRDLLANETSDSDDSLLFRFIVPTQVIKIIAEDVCKSVGVDFEENYDKLEKDIFDKFEYDFTLEEPVLVDCHNGIAFTTDSGVVDINQLKIGSY